MFEAKTLLSEGILIFENLSQSISKKIFLIFIVYRMVADRSEDD